MTEQLNKAIEVPNHLTRSIHKVLLFQSKFCHFLSQSIDLVKESCLLKG